LRTVGIGSLILLVLGSILASPAVAVDYNDTNPGATPCGNGTNPVQTLRTFYVKSGGLAYARVELRWSPTCNTVWTKVVNVTGSGSGYASERSLTSTERILVYNCPDTSCEVHDQTETGDVLPGYGSSGWSHQFVLPSNGSMGSPAAPQPPTIRGIVLITSGASTYVLDTALEPMWTWYANNFANERIFRDDGDRVFSCTNSPDRCTTQADATVWYELDPSLNNTTGTADVVADIKTILLPAWSASVGSTPTMSWCNPGCAEDVLIKAVAVGDPDLGSAYAVTVPDGGFTSGTPAFFVHQTIKIKLAAYSHTCGTVDDGCTNAAGDDRPLISHEIAHTLGMGHCDMDFRVMCHVKSTTTSELAEGTMYWTPRTLDKRALRALYP
jgi:hypothetical protein